MVAQNLGMKTVIFAQLSVRFEKLRTIVRMLKKKNDNRAFSEWVTVPRILRRTLSQQE